MRAITLAIGMLCTLTVQADRFEPFEGKRSNAPENPNVEEYRWKESETMMPSYPKDSDLIPFKVHQMAGRFDYFLDSKTLSVGGGDSIIRYVLVVRSKTGANNISYEGVRCDSGEYKIYGYGIRETIKPVRNPQWKPLGDRRQLLHRKILQGYFCDHYRAGMNTPEKIINSIKYGADDFHQTIPDR